MSKSAREELNHRISHPRRLELIEFRQRSQRDITETHFRVEISSTAFAGLSRVARQRLVYDVLAEELRDPVHALSLATTTPEEDGAS